MKVLKETTWTGILFLLMLLPVNEKNNLNKKEK